MDGEAGKPTRQAQADRGTARRVCHLTEVRRAVWKRDQGCCQWKLASGEICGSRYRLQHDHIEPRARAGETTIGNVRLLCQRHNLLAARQVYGEGLMRNYRRGLAGPPALRSRPGAPAIPALPLRLE